MTDHFTFIWEAEEAPLTTSNDIIFGVPSAHDVQLESRGRSYVVSSCLGRRRVLCASRRVI